PVLGGAEPPGAELRGGSGADPRGAPERRDHGGRRGRPLEAGVFDSGAARDRARARDVSPRARVRAGAARPGKARRVGGAAMTVVVFLGPTLPVDAARAELDAIYLPPAGQGDVYRVAREQPFAIGIVDGVFESVPAVWHKEILWALARGIHVVGGGSMGALRAAELARFGMQGVGRIFEA